MGVVAQLVLPGVRDQERSCSGLAEGLTNVVGLASGVPLREQLKRGRSEVSQAGPLQPLGQPHTPMAPDAGALQVAKPLHTAPFEARGQSGGGGGRGCRRHVWWAAASLNTTTNIARTYTHERRLVAV